MLKKYQKIIYLAFMLFYIVLPFCMFIFSNDIHDYASATFILILGLFFNVILKNNHNKQVEEILKKLF